MVGIHFLTNNNCFSFSNSKNIKYCDGIRPMKLSCSLSQRQNIQDRDHKVVMSEYVPLTVNGRVTLYIQDVSVGSLFSSSYF